MVAIVRGAFIKQAVRNSFVADAAKILFFKAFEPYRVRHVDLSGDECVVLEFAPQILAEANARRGDALPAFGLPFAQATANTLLLSHEILNAPDRREHALSAEESALAILDIALNPNARPVGASQRSAKIVNRAQEALAARPLHAWRLAELSAETGVSPYYLSRLFAAHTGHTISQYQTRLRLAEALKRIREGERNLSFLAIDLGFSSHSHFSLAFRKTFGRTPSQIRSIGSMPKCDEREISKKMTAPSAERQEIRRQATRMEDAE